MARCASSLSLGPCPPGSPGSTPAICCSSALIPSLALYHLPADCSTVMVQGMDVSLPLSQCKDGCNRKGWALRDRPGTAPATPAGMRPFAAWGQPGRALRRCSHPRPPRQSTRHPPNALHDARHAWPSAACAQRRTPRLALPCSSVQVLLPLAGQPHHAALLPLLPRLRRHGMRVGDQPLLQAVLWYAVAS